MSGETVRLTPEEAEAVRELVELAVELRRSGLLSLLKTVAELGEHLEEALVSDPALMRSLGLAQAALTGISRPGPEEFRDARKTAEEASECLVRGLSTARREGWTPVGLLGLLGALRDKRVQAGLGFLLALARGLGDCLLKTSNNKKD